MIAPSGQNFVILHLQSQFEYPEHDPLQFEEDTSHRQDRKASLFFISDTDT